MSTRRGPVVLVVQRLFVSGRSRKPSLNNFAKKGAHHWATGHRQRIIVVVHSAMKTRDLIVRTVNDIVTIIQLLTLSERIQSS